MKTDYNREMEAAIASFEGHRPSLFIHACCAPCSTSVLERIGEYFDVTVYYYNPNIMPGEEYILRAEQFAKIPQIAGGDVKLIVADYNEDEFLKEITGLENEPEGGNRCGECFRVRLEKTAALAEWGGFDYFATTLTVSPHKNAQIINTIGANIAAGRKTLWLPTDFKKKNGYLRSIELSKEYGLYRQNYCGCGLGGER